LKEHIENELTKAIQPTVTKCFNSMKDDYTKKGYQVGVNEGPIAVKILPKNTILEINNSLTMTKDATNKYSSFKVILNNNLYQVIGVARSIVEGEAADGQIETTDLMAIYHNLIIQKLKQTDGTKIYVITDQPTGDRFMLASRSQAFPPGY
jgi:hypothetical protein